MSSRIILAGLLVLSLSLLSCEKLPETAPATAPQGPLRFEGTSVPDGIPIGYGKLVAVVSHPQSAHWAALWFEAEDSTISVVWVNVVEGRIQDNVLRIPRK